MRRTTDLGRERANRCNSATVSGSLRRGSVGVVSSADFGKPSYPAV